MGMEFHRTYADGFSLRSFADQRSYVLRTKPGLSRNFLRGLVLCFPLASALWVGIIYSASRLAR